MKNFNHIFWRTVMFVLTGFTLLECAGIATAQTSPAWGRISLITQIGRQSGLTGDTNQTSEFITSVALHSATKEEGGFEYSFDTRSASYSGGEQTRRTSIYDAYVGYRTKEGWGARVGQMWLNELGGLGSLGGLHLEYRQPSAPDQGRYRVGVFFGTEPKAFETGFVQGVKKGGAYVAYDGVGARRHVLGYVTVRNGNLIERSTLTTTNFVPALGNKFFFYQAAEYDVQGPAGQKKAGLNYLFATARYAPVQAFEIQTTYHHGLSIDARTITNDQLNGRPVNPVLVQGLLFESIGGRVTVQVAKGVRFWVGYSQDKNNRSDQSQTRSSAGMYTSNLFGSGLDISATASRIDRSMGPYDSWYVSIGRSLGQRVYLSADYTTSLAVVRTTGTGGITIETRPETKRYSLSSSINLSRSFSLMLTAERLSDQDMNDDRGMLGITYRF